MLDVERGPCERVLLVGLGKKDGFGRKQYKKALLAAAAAVAQAGRARRRRATCRSSRVADTDAYYRGRLAAEPVGSALYRVPAIRSTRKPPAAGAEELRHRGAGAQDQKTDAERGLEHGRGIAAGAALTRDLANLPANVCTPTLPRAAGARTRARTTSVTRRRCSTRPSCAA